MHTHTPFTNLAFCIRTFGCQMNKHDSERVAGMLEGLGALPVDAIEDADLVVFMTCCVREAADTRLYGQVASLKNTPLRAGAPLSKRVVAVGGCIGQRDGQKLVDELPHLDVVFGTHNLGSLPRLLEEALDEGGHHVEVLDAGSSFASELPTAREHAWAAWLPIAQGCNNFCSYCIVPYVRGREKSRPLEDIVAEAEGYVAAGVKEITCTARPASRPCSMRSTPRASSACASRRAIRRTSPTRSSAGSARCARSCRRSTCPCSRAPTPCWPP